MNKWPCYIYFFLINFVEVTRLDSSDNTTKNIVISILNKRAGAFIPARKCLTISCVFSYNGLIRIDRLPQN